VNPEKEASGQQPSRYRNQITEECHPMQTETSAHATTPLERLVDIERRLE